MSRLVNATVVEPYVIEVTCADGRIGRVDVSAELYGEVFEPLNDPDFFMKGEFDPKQGTIAWPNGADFAPEFLAAAAFGVTA